MRLLTLLLFAVLAACSDPTDDVVGDACSTDRDCAERCYSDSDKFPGGFCSLACDSDNDCPLDTACTDTSGGVCLFACPAFDCGYLGPGWRCEDRSRRGDGGDVAVCIGD